MQRKPELMAPAGSKEALRAAVAGGADAVYFGGRRFNAREFAENFEPEEIEEAVDYLHERGVRAYITVNTLLADSELEQALDYLAFLARTGVDGVIVQDLGLIKLAREVLPGLKLIGSTQMTVANAAGVEMLARLGLSRVVLARELSLHEIRAIRQKSALELEVFVHGALCFAYSGQCLLSSMVGGRSGNRGRCAQPCRLPYTLVDARGRPVAGGAEHLLSTRDLNTLALLPQIIASGVDAFKIEGRMRRPEYVAVVTRLYRRAIDRYFEDPGKFEILPEEEEAAAQAFNRQFTAGYFLGNPGAGLMSYGRPSNRGVYLGRIVARGPGLRADLRLERVLRRGDGIEVWVKQGGHVGTEVCRLWVDGREVDEAPAGRVVALELPPQARVGDRVFKTHDVRLMAEARRAYTGPREERKVPVWMEVWAAPGRPLEIEVRDAEGHKGRGATVFRAEPAREHSLTPEFLERQLNRLGNTPYELQGLNVHLDGEIMVPFSEINAVRREAIENLRSSRLSAWPRVEVDAAKIEGAIRRLLVAGRPVAFPSGTENIPRLAVAAGSPAAAEAALASGADRVYLGGERWRQERLAGEAGLEKLLECGAKKGAEVIPALPRIWQEDEAGRIEAMVASFKDCGAAMVLAGNLGSLTLVARAGLAAWADYQLNVFNNLALVQLAQLGVAGAAVSPELNRGQLQNLRQDILPLEVIVQGSLPLMVSAHCVLGARLGGKAGEKKCPAPCRKNYFGLQDRLGLIFPVTTDERCRFYLYNPKEICLVEQLPDLINRGFKFLRLELREKEAALVGRITSLYRRALDAVLSGHKSDLESIAAEIEALAPAGLTRGHYYRGVI
ncbi:MAG: family peptidase [Clostridia bacterium]|nr:family peptidase [Clostridia bacterium]